MLKKSLAALAVVRGLTVPADTGQGGHGERVPNPAAGDCGGAADIAPLGGHEMVLHARNSATSPWYVVGVSKTDAQGKYTFVITNTGAREYRGVLKESAAAGVAQYQSISASKVTRATPQVLQASFVQPIIELGQQPNARVTVSPYRSQQVALQFQELERSVAGADVPDADERQRR